MKALARLGPYLRRRRGAYALGLFLVVGATACSQPAPLIVKTLIERLEAGSATADGILLAAVAILAVAALRAVLLFGGRYLLLAASRHVEYEMRNDLFAHLETLSAPYYDRNATGEVTSRAINDLEGVRMMFGVGAMAVASTGLLFVASAASMIWVHPKLALLCLLPLAAVSLVMAVAGSRMQALSLDVQAQLGLLSGRAQENFSGARVVRAFVQEEREVERFRGLCEEYRDRNLRLARWRAGGWAAILVLAESAMAVTLFAGGRGLADGTLTLGVLGAFVAYQFQLLWPMIAIGWVVNLVQRGVACMGRLEELWATKPDVDDRAARPLSAPIRGRIEARNLTFSYAPDRPPALKDVSFTIEPGAQVALVGRTGSGKTTVLQLLLRHYPVPAGMLFVDGVDVNEIPVDALRAAIGAVPQDPFLFSERIRDNIAFGSLAEPGEEAIRAAAERSRLSADLGRFADGLDQVIGERGVTLSGGQRQRLAIARALVREPRILLLDDALSSVDSQTEREIQERLREVRLGRTAIVVTHRLADVVDADLVLVLDEGRLAERGRHHDLVSAGGVYARLWDRQKLGEELARA